MRTTHYWKCPCHTVTRTTDSLLQVFLDKGKEITFSQLSTYNTCGGMSVLISVYLS